MKRWIWIVALAVGCLFEITPAYGTLYDAAGHKLPDDQIGSSQVSWDIPTHEDHPEDGSVGMLVGSGRCTATYIDTGSVMSAPAYLITAGHCIEPMPRPEEIRVDASPGFGMEFIPKYYVGSAPGDLTAIRVRRVAYGTMKGTDIAILELSATRSQVTRALALVPFKLGSTRAAMGTAVQNLGFPLSGMPRRLQGLHHSVCTVGQYIPVREDGYSFALSFRHHCSGLGGSSGSPMISAADGKIIGIFNTGVSDEGASRPECAEDHPCEISPDGATSTHLLENYAQDSTPAGLCFDAHGRFDLAQPGCRLEKPADDESGS